MVLKENGVNVGLNFCDSVLVPAAGSPKHHNETSGSLKDGYWLSRWEGSCFSRRILPREVKMSDRRIEDMSKIIY
jgi:hypothetical protein